MTRDEARNNLIKLMNILCSGETMWNKETIKETLLIAISELESGIREEIKNMKIKEKEEKDMEITDEYIHVNPYEDIDNDQTYRSVVLIDQFIKTYCRYAKDYERFGEVKFRCEECPFQADNGSCLCRSFKNKYAPEYRNFGRICI